MANNTNSVIYIGVTNDLKRRCYEHKNKLVKGFTYMYNVDKLVYFERYQNIDDAIKREKQLKKWNRAWKDRLINEMNPEWKDLYETIGE